jgi:hypothetical protein
MRPKSTEEPALQPTKYIEIRSGKRAGTKIPEPEIAQTEAFHSGEVTYPVNDRVQGYLDELETAWDNGFTFPQVKQKLLSILSRERKLIIRDTMQREDLPPSVFVVRPHQRDISVAPKQAANDLIDLQPQRLELSFTGSLGIPKEYMTTEDDEEDDEETLAPQRATKKISSTRIMVPEKVSSTEKLAAPKEIEEFVVPKETEKPPVKETEKPPAKETEKLVVPKETEKPPAKETEKLVVPKETEKLVVPKETEKPISKEVVEKSEALKEDKAPEEVEDTVPPEEREVSEPQDSEERTETRRPLKVVRKKKGE